MHQRKPHYLRSIRGGRRPSPRRDAIVTYAALALLFILFVAAGTSDYNAAVAERQATQYQR